MRIRYLVKRSLRVAMLYGILFSGLIFLLAEELCMGLYSNAEAGKFLKLYAVLIPMLYCDAITDAMTKGLGQQKICVRNNIITSALDVIFLFLLLPKYGMNGYFFSFLVTHLVNFLLSLHLLTKITGLKIPFYIPGFSAAGAIASVWAVSHLSAPALQATVYPILLGCALFLLGILSREDIRWLKGLVSKK
jgi:O-antigen/teichoic acid export membrane protein